ncbi:MAG: sulfotransferase family 2 domain-containing protein [Pseudomonadota bacterium]
MNPARGLIDASGLGPAYHALWWRAAAKRRPLITDWARRHNTVFVHVPKTAGLSVYRALGMDRPADTHAPAFAYRSADTKFFDSAFRFAVVRNPWDRMVSAFYYLKFESSYTQDRAWADRRLAQFSDFRNFAEALTQPLFRNQVIAWRHFLPQSLYLNIGGACAMDQLIAFDRLDHELADVAEKLGTSYERSHENQSRRGDYRSYYTDDSAELIARLYAEDVALTGAVFDG